MRRASTDKRQSFFHLRQWHYKKLSEKLAKLHIAYCIWNIFFLDDEGKMLLYFLLDTERAFLSREDWGMLTIYSISICFQFFSFQSSVSSQYDSEFIEWHNLIYFLFQVQMSLSPVRSSVNLSSLWVFPNLLLTNLLSVWRAHIQLTIRSILFFVWDTGVEQLPA